MSSKVIILGDTHFGIKKFSLEFLDNQLELFNSQIFPYMQENNIKEIYQLGDLFDNRTTAEVGWLESVKSKFFETLKEKDIVLYTLLGNHDIYFRESREISLIETFSELYPNNFKIFKERTSINLLGRETYIVPWITKNESLEYNEIKDKEIILGHFEIRDFSMVKGHVDKSSKLTKNFFKTDTKVDRVFSGHYHLKNTDSDIKYLGTPFQLTFADHKEEKGFYVWDGWDLEFIENTCTKRFIEIHYNDSNLDGNVEVIGLAKESLYYTKDDFKDTLESLEKHDCKFIVKESKNRDFDDIIFNIKESKIKVSISNQQEVKELIGDVTNIDESVLKDTRKFILDKVKDSDENLIPTLLEIFSDLDSITS